MATKLRPPAVPLVTVDPYFNVWSNRNTLYEGKTVHWTFDETNPMGIHEMTGLIRIDNEIWRFIGCNKQTEKVKNLEQVNVEVKPLTTVYEFQGGGISLQVEFMTPLLLDDLTVLSRPVSYVTFTVSVLGNKEKDIEIYFDVTGEWAVNERDQQVEWGQELLSSDLIDLKIGTTEQPILEKSGDNLRIDWGYLHLLNPVATENQVAISGENVRTEWIENKKLVSDKDADSPRSLKENMPVLATVIDFNKVSQMGESHFLAIAYDDIYSVEYFHKKLPGYWRRNGQTFSDILLSSIQDYPELKIRCEEINSEIAQEAENIAGERYKDIVSLAYRQAIAAHKLVEDDEDGLLFLSKENNSNGCMATVDVSYPSIPLFLQYNPSLVKGMLTPIFTFARSDDWKFDFAPHDIGTYPLGNCQVYGENKLEYQMPIEECGNMLIMTTAVTLAEGDNEFAKEHWDLLTKWAQHLIEYGLDPKDQLCTDDFAGHLAHNTNLSIKAIIGIGSYSILCDFMGNNDEAESYLSKAKELAVKWEMMAKEEDHYKLAFDQQNTWSLKYNLVWDELFSLNLFSKEIKTKEVDYYLTKLNHFGVPLDSREEYTKIDWLLWVAGLTEDKVKSGKIIDSIWNFLNETEDRVPFCDWYDTKTAKRLNFKNRSVVGGMFLLFLKRNKWMKKSTS